MTTTVRRLISEFGGLKRPVEELTDDADLYAAGLRSFSSVQLMLALEEAYDVEFPESLLNRQSFQSIRAIEDAVGQLTNARVA